MCSGCESLIAEENPSSVTQLPILTALDARLSTLFAVIIHQSKGNVNTYFEVFGICRGISTFSLRFG